MLIGVSKWKPVTALYFLQKKITWGGPQGAILNAELALSLGKELVLS